MKGTMSFRKGKLVLAILLFSFFKSSAQSATHLNFDGVNDLVNMGQHSAFDFTTGTVEAWIKVPANSSNKVIVANRTAASNTQTRWSLHVNEGANTLGIWNGFSFSTIPATINPNTWYHVAFVLSTSSTTVYLNGNSLGTIGIGINTNSTNNPFLLGASDLTNAYPGEYFWGDMDEVRVWNIALTAADIQRRRNCELAGNETGLIAYYKLNHGNNAAANSAFTQAADAGPNGFNGTLTNFALNGTTSNWLSGSPVTTGVAVPSIPVVSSPVTYSQGSSASPLTATTGGTGLLWYTVATGGTGASTAPTPSTATVGSTTYYVSSTNANGCESARVALQVDVKVVPATHLNFDGVNDYVQIPEPAFENLSQGTIETWVKLNSIDEEVICARQFDGSNTYAVLSVGGFASTGGGWIPSTPGKVFFHFKNGDPILQSAMNLSTGQWYHIAITFNGTMGSLYIDGNLQGQVSGSIFLPGVGAGPISTIGGWLGNGGGRYLNGNIDEFRIWTVYSTQEEIRRRKNCEAASTEPGLRVNYHFNQGNDAASNAGLTTCIDSRSGMSGTLNNFALSGNSSNWLAGSPVLSGASIPTTPTTVGSVTVCLQSTPNLASYVSNATNLIWYSVPSGGTGSLSTPVRSTATASGALYYYVANYNPATGCESARASLGVTVQNSYGTLAGSGSAYTVDVTGKKLISSNNGGCSAVIAMLNPAGTNPLAGNTTGKVWREATQSPEFVKRHFEITPAANANTATATVTLYFTQQDFDEFNLVNAKKLPTNSTDAAGKGNLLIEKRSGISSNSTGLPDTYSGSVITIDPDDNKIIWNSTASRWEVTFDVTGFSGFFVKSTSFTLPVQWLDMSLTGQNGQVRVSWTVEEKGTSYYEVESSTDATSFETIGTVNAKTEGQHTYIFDDHRLYAANTSIYYRIRQVDADGQYSYSKTMRLKNSNSPISIQVYPNPARHSITVSSSIAEAVQICDLKGTVLKQFQLKAGINTIDISHFSSGIYLLRTGNGEMIKLIKP